MFYTFYINDNRWYIDLPEWEGSIDDLEMVCGADTMLDIIAQGRDKIRVQIGIDEFDGWSYRLDFVREEFDGGWYSVTHFSKLITTFECWLCKVTKFVFGDLPKVIYFK